MAANIRLAALLLILGAAACGNTTAPAAPSQVSTPAAPQNPLPRPPAPSPDADAVTFAPGRHRVGEAIQPGRYFSDPNSGCYWERQSGTAGQATDTIAFAFVGFDAGQTIVDIAGTDVAFQANAACGTWSDRPRSSGAGAIAAGTWLVGDQVAPGTYRTDAALGCYWERLRDFSGSTASVIASDIVARAGPTFVNVLPGDTGFSSHGGCGTWTLIQAAESSPVAPPRLRTLPHELPR
jgi:hypothetical protein